MGRSWGADWEKPPVVAKDQNPANNTWIAWSQVSAQLNCRFTDIVRAPGLKNSAKSCLHSWTTKWWHSKCCCGFSFKPLLLGVICSTAVDDQYTCCILRSITDGVYCPYGWWMRKRTDMLHFLTQQATPNKSWDWNSCHSKPKASHHPLGWAAGGHMPFYRGWRWQGCCFGPIVPMKADKNFMSEDRLVRKSLGTTDHRGLPKYFHLNTEPLWPQAGVNIFLQRVRE